LLVATDDEAILGYAQSSAYRPKPCYAGTRETSIYLTPDAQGQGLGRQMYDDLLGWLVADGIRTVVAAVALPNPASLALHRACGFEEVGVMREVGRKFDRWIDVLWLEKSLA
jgi:phosphinothricin acetyltransferase